MKLIKNILVLLLILSTLFSVASCKNDDKNDGNDQTDAFNSCEITVKNPLGKPLSGVTVYLHLDGESDYNICAAPATTNAEGKVSFNLNSTENYSVQLTNYPVAYIAKSGMNRDERYVIDSNKVEIMLEVGDGTVVPKTYSKFDYMSNFTVLDIEGGEYTLYDMLAEKKAVVLNYWFYNCGYCTLEFPYLNEAYNSNKDKVALLAINDCDPISKVQAYESDKGITLDFPLVRADGNSDVALGRFNIVSYPTTVIIDRFGMISYIHSGAIDSVSEWQEIFDYYTSDDYNGMPYNG